MEKAGGGDEGGGGIFRKPSVNESYDIRWNDRKIRRREQISMLSLLVKPDGILFIALFCSPPSPSQHPPVQTLVTHFD